ncbi:MAG TPA: glycosyltransferase family 9 protein [Magnetospirillum sp.]|nr:glycosyltransferase family 9 protein [Magnetospirillum sp.]
MQEFAKSGSEASQKVLIVKTGYSETLDPGISGIVSLGDVFRSTVLLHLFPPPTYHVTWLTDEKAVGLLKDNPGIQRILKVTPFTPYLLEREWFDVVVNLEKDPGVCALTDRISARERYGFRFDARTCSAGAHPLAEECLSISTDAKHKRSHGKAWSEVLFNVLGRRYEGQGNILGYRPRSSPIHDVGFNHKVGVKFPLKLWPQENWAELERRLQGRGASVAWQESEHDLEGYIEWINRCRVVVTSDSLGLHIAMALGKKVVALFGPTIDFEVEDHPNLTKIVAPVQWPCRPCLDSACRNGEWCMPHIGVEPVFAATSRFLDRAQG